VTASDISQLAGHIMATVAKRGNARGGRGAAEHLIAAFRCMYKFAVADGGTCTQTPQTTRVAGNRLVSTTPDQLAAIMHDTEGR
jgi:integrase/recombinase XerC